MTRTPFFYAKGYQTVTGAEIDIQTLFEEGEISAADRPEVKSYRNHNNEMRYAIVLHR